MRAKPDLVPDCDIHGEPMYRDECPARAFGLEEPRDLIVWRCAREGCGRYFQGILGYCYRASAAEACPPTPRCHREGAFLVVQRALGSYICPVAGCTIVRDWQVPDSPLIRSRPAVRKPSLSAR
jgi:hypothetical protein